MASAEVTKTVSYTFSLTTSKSSLVTSRMMNRMFETTVYIGLTRLSALPSVRGRRGSARGKSLHKTGEKLKRFYRRLSTADRRGPANASVEMSSTLGTSPLSAILGETFRIASAQHQQAPPYSPDSSCQAQDSLVLCSNDNCFTLYMNSVPGVLSAKRLGLEAFEQLLMQITRWFCQTFHARYAEILPITLQS
jgi:hypothetical protein